MTEKGFSDIREKQSPIKQDDIYRVSDSKRPPWDINNKETPGDIKISLGKGMESVDKAELQEAIQTAKESISFIIEHAASDVEVKTAQVLENMAKEGKVFIAVTGRPIYGYFQYGHDPKTGKEVRSIVLDYGALLAYGKAETIDTLTHEGYHAAQHEEGHKNDCVEEETRAWNIGLEMSNQYREEVGEYIAQTKPYTQRDIENKGYRRDLGVGVFTELTGKSTGGMA
jgi:hypothetical protein